MDIIKDSALYFAVQDEKLRKKAKEYVGLKKPIKPEKVKKK